jgi:hypothetical protein
MELRMCLGVLLLATVQTGCVARTSIQRVTDATPQVAEMELRQQPSILLTGGKDGLFQPRYECMQMGCPATVRCGPAVCSVIHCGKQQCRYCPEPLPDFFKNIAFKAWCSYGCMTGSVRTGTAFGLVTTFGETFTGPYCLDEPTATSLMAGQGEE